MSLAKPNGSAVTGRANGRDSIAVRGELVSRSW